MCSRAALRHPVGDGTHIDCHDDELLAPSLGARGLKTVARQSPHREYLKALLKEAKSSAKEQTKQVGQWAQGTLFATP